MDECPIPTDVFRIILRHSYPQIAANLLQTCKKIAKLADKSLYTYWLEKFFPDINIKLDPREAFIREWKIPRYAELYEEDAVYDIERLMHMTIIPLEITKRRIGRILVVSRFQSSTALSSIKLEKSHYFNNRVEVTITNDKINILNASRQIRGSFLSIFNRETFLRTLKTIKTAQNFLHDKMYYYNITAFGSTIFVHNATLIKSLASRKNVKVCAFDKGTTIKQIKFKEGFWNEAIIDNEEYIFLN